MQIPFLNLNEYKFLMNQFRAELDIKLFFFQHFYQNEFLPCQLELQNMLTAPLQRDNLPLPTSHTRLPVGFGWQAVMLKDSGRVARDPATKVVRDLQHSALALTGLDRQLERPNPINPLVISL